MTTDTQFRTLKIALIMISLAGLVLTIVPSVLVFMQEITLDEHKQMMLIGMLMWFLTSPYWLKEQEL